MNFNFLRKCLVEICTAHPIICSPIKLIAQ